MDFSDGVAGHRGHLDPSAGREVVFCHSCSNEWYNDQHGLQCPRCRSEICEIITPENDPRDIPPESSNSDILRGSHFGPHDFGRPGRDHYDDPDEEDIEELESLGNNVETGPGGFRWSQQTYRSPERQRNDLTRGPGYQSPVDPSGEQEIFQRFQETLNMLTGFPLPPGRASREALYGGGDGNATGTGPRTTTYRSPSGHTSFTITTGAVPTRAGGRGADPDDNFDMVFGNLVGRGGLRPPQSATPALEGGLQNLFSILLGPGGSHAVHGDAVYSQEALDRIITQLMEANPQSNAAPPASEAAIQNLDKKRIDKEMMDDNGKAECTICIDEMHLGDEVTVLPCKHWFHGECVTLWLKEHNTCPVCRAPIDQRNGNNNGGNGSSGGNGNGAIDGATGNRFVFGPFFATSEPWPSSGGSGSGSSSSQNHHGRGAQTPEERERRLNAIRNVAGPSSYGQATPESPRPQRRDSWSPTSPSPRASASARNRSPPGYRQRPVRTNTSGFMSGDSSQRSSRSSNNSGSNGGGASSSNPLSWLRDRFTGNNNGNTGNGNSSSGNGSRRRS
ncbi:putative RING finger protein P32A8.03c [Cytospora mali]|uniref:RING-type E3 ubiquitin transferase n=1 Tax=Cytospora mali TaxID=578113 RepID=A0A194VWE4_CYTMA|nr:putative RING finger protein P32A8.03c [Valsa mali]